jgi:mRNA interferase HigB
MHLISIRNLREDAARYPDVKKQLDNWYATVKAANWQNLEEVRQIYQDAEAVGNFTVFNIKGNDYRLIVGINYENQTVYYKYLLTHSEYNKDKWKNDPYF